MSPHRQIMRTPRLALRPSTAADGERAFEIQSNWNVTRMLRMAAYPPTREDMSAWFGVHESEWREGAAFRFAILLEGHMIGLVDLAEMVGDGADLGYWLDEPFWGLGLASEAGAAVVTFAFEALGLARLRSGHASDNPASGRVLEKLGFRAVGEIPLPSRSRGEAITQRTYELDRDRWTARSGATIG